jgi:hypothetical protein
MQSTLNKLDNLLIKKNPLTQQIIKGTAPDNIVSFASQGLLPIPSSEILEIAVFLIINDSKYKDNALKTLSKYKPNDLVEILKRQDLLPEVYDYFADVKNYNKQIIQTLLYNKATPNSAFEKIAETGSEDLLEIIVTNQVRLLNYPPLIDKLLRNEKLTSDQKRRLIEFREEFFEKVSVGNPLFRGKQEEEPRKEEILPQVQEVIVEPVKKEEKTEVEAPSVEEIISEILEKKEAPQEAVAEEKEIETLSEEEFKKAAQAAAGILNEQEIKSKKMVSVFNKIMRMTIPEKIQLAILGTREERSILIRDSNKQVALAVLKSPKLTEVDVEVISTFRQVDPEILQGIAANKKWIRNYNVVLNLVKNPKTPPGIAISLLNRLTLMDLKILKMNKNVPEYIRRVAQQKILEKSSGAS